MRLARDEPKTVVQFRIGDTVRLTPPDASTDEDWLAQIVGIRVPDDAPNPIKNLATGYLDVEWFYSVEQALALGSRLCVAAGCCSLLTCCSWSKTDRRYFRALGRHEYMRSNHRDAVQVETVMGGPMTMLRFDDAAKLGDAICPLVEDGHDEAESTPALAYAAGSTDESPYWRMSIRFVGADKPPALLPRVRVACSPNRPI